MNKHSTSDTDSVERNSPLELGKGMEDYKLKSLPFVKEINGGNIAKLVEQVSTEITSQFVIEILSSGHSALLCEQDEWDRMAADYHNCVHQVQHQLRCGGHGGVCQWVQAFVDSCTGQVMGQCWTKQAIELLKKRQA